MSMILYDKIIFKEEESASQEILSEKEHPLLSTIQFYMQSPSQENIFRFLDSLFLSADINIECAIITLVYIERMLENTQISLHSMNWARIVLGGFILANKVWDDHAVWSIDFCGIFPDVAVTDMQVATHH